MPIDDRLQIRAMRDYRLHYGVSLFVRKGNSIITNVIFEDHSPDTALSNESIFTLQDGDAQQLMDDLYGLGFRPTEGRSGVQEIKAMKEHIGDLRKIVDTTLKSGPRVRLARRPAEGDDEYRD